MPKVRLPFATFGLTSRGEALPKPRQFESLEKAVEHLDAHADAIHGGDPDSAHFAEVRRLPDEHDTVESWAEAGGGTSDGPKAKLVHRWQAKQKGGKVRRGRHA